MVAQVHAESFHYDWMTANNRGVCPAKLISLEKPEFREELTVAYAVKAMVMAGMPDKTAAGVLQGLMSQADSQTISREPKEFAIWALTNGCGLNDRAASLVLGTMGA
jgi:hypothetical protein